MSLFENPLQHIQEATDAAVKIVELQTDVFLLKQEIRTLRQIKRAIWLGVSLISLNLMFALTIYWLEMILYDHGWSALGLALLSFFVLGGLAAVFAGIGYFVGKSPQKG